MKIYLAGPFFNDTEVKNIEYAERVLAGRGFDVFSPMRHEVRDEESGSSAWARKIFEMDRAAISEADTMAVMYYGTYSDSGTAWECGYACALGKPAVLVHADPDADANIMMHCGCRANIRLEELETYDFETMPEREYHGAML